MHNIIVISPLESNSYQNDPNTKFEFTIEYSMANVFKLKDNRYLITPINPMYSSLIISELDSLRKYIEVKRFPFNEKLDSTFIRNEDKILNFSVLKDDLLTELSQFSGFKINSMSLDDINKLCLKLSDSKKIDTLKINLVMLVGDHILQKTQNKSYKWCLHKRLGGVNPVYFPVLYNENEKKYIEIYERLNTFLSEIKTYKKADINFSIKMMLEFEKRNQYNEIVCW